MTTRICPIRAFLSAHFRFVHCFVETNQWAQKMPLPPESLVSRTDQENRSLWKQIGSYDTQKKLYRLITEVERIFTSLWRRARRILLCARLSYAPCTRMHTTEKSFRIRKHGAYKLILKVIMGNKIIIPCFFRFRYTVDRKWVTSV